jgi:UDP-N-acetylglucosamine acyltransferase
VSIHPTAQVEKGAELGEGVTVGPFAFIAAGAKVGDGCVVGPHAVIYRHVTLAAKCQVHAGAVLGDTPQDLAFKDVPTFVRIGEGTVLREHVTIHRGTKEGTETVVGDGCFLMANSHLAHNVRLGNQVILANGVLLAGYVEVGDRAFLSGNVVVHQFTRIGRVAMLSGGSGIGKDVPPFCVTPGITRNVVAGLNVVGMRRAGLNPAARAEVKEAFRILYRSGLNVKQALPELQARFTTGPGREFADFVAASKRGVCPFAGGDAEESSED